MEEDFKQPLLEQEQEKSVFEGILTQTYQSANKGTRFLNNLLDMIFYFICMVLLGVLLGVASLLFGFDISWIDQENSLVTRLLGIVFFFLYYLFFESIFATTPAKWITQTIVITENGEKPDFRTIVIRSLCRIVPFEAFTFFGEPDGGFHDAKSHTRVVTKRSYKEVRKYM